MNLVNKLCNKSTQPDLQHLRQCCIKIAWRNNVVYYHFMLFRPNHVQNASMLKICMKNILFHLSDFLKRH